MKPSVPTLAPLLRSDLQGDLLAKLWLSDDEYTLTDLARELDVSVSQIHTEIERLAAADMLQERRVGTARLVKADHDHPLSQPLTDLLRLTYGPAAVLPEILDGIAGLDAAYIYGSWAERRMGEPGAFPRDVDVLLVGTTKGRVSARVQREASERLGREVNVAVIAPSEWEKPTQGFTKTVKRGALVPLAVK